MNKTEKTVNLHMSGEMNCTQAILTVYGEAFGVDPDTAKLLGGPFGGGLGGMGKTCGYIIGALLVVAHAKSGQDKREINEAGKKLITLFEKKHETLMCKELLGIDKDIPSKERVEIVGKRCPALGRDVAEILQELL